MMDELNYFSCTIHLCIINISLFLKIYNNNLKIFSIIFSIIILEYLP